MIAYDGTTDNNLRYIGANPNNYVYFNCTNYSSSDDDTCELWRIIGVFNENSHGRSGENLVKIIRNDVLEEAALGNYNLEESTLITNLNGNYLSQSGNYAINGITYSSRDMIEMVTWKTGDIAYQSSTPNIAYEGERGDYSVPGYPGKVDGKVALMYASDYGFATGGSSSVSRDVCLSQYMVNWYDNYIDCKTNNWLYDANGEDQLTITMNNSPQSVVGFGNRYSQYITYYYSNYSSSIRPSLYLKENVTIVGGDGTKENPYRLSL